MGEFFGWAVVVVIVIIGIAIKEKYFDQKKVEKSKDCETQSSKVLNGMTQAEIRAAATELVDACSLGRVASGEFPSINVTKIGWALIDKYGKDAPLYEVVELIDFPPTKELVISVWKSIGILTE